eukprot:g56651.t1
MADSLFPPQRLSKVRVGTPPLSLLWRQQPLPLSVVQRWHLVTRVHTFSCQLNSAGRVLWIQGNRALTSLIGRHQRGESAVSGIEIPQSCAARGHEGLGHEVTCPRRGHLTCIEDKSALRGCATCAGFGHRVVSPRLLMLVAFLADEALLPFRSCRQKPASVLSIKAKGVIFPRFSRLAMKRTSSKPFVSADLFGLEEPMASVAMVNPTIHNSGHGSIQANRVSVSSVVKSVSVASGLMTTSINEIGESQVGTRPDAEGHVTEHHTPGHSSPASSHVSLPVPIPQVDLLRSSIDRSQHGSARDLNVEAIVEEVEAENKLKREPSQRLSRGFTELFEQEPDPGSFKGPLVIQPGMTKEEIRELRILAQRQRADRSGSALVIQHAFRHHKVRRLRAFTSGQLEEKKALQQFSMSFQAITEIRSKAIESKAIEWSDLKDLRTLSSGMFGEVHTARFKTYTVVVKTLKPIQIPPGATSKQRKRLREDQELAIMDFKKEMSMLTKLWHRNIVHLIGVGVKPRLFMVMEFMAGGSLQDVLKQTREQCMPLEHGLILKWALDICYGMRYLHEAYPRILHRDVKPANLLINKRYVVGHDVAYGDFGGKNGQPRNSDEQLKERGPEMQNEENSSSLWFPITDEKSKANGKRSEEEAKKKAMADHAALLLEDVPDVKIADFGLSRVLGPSKGALDERYRLTGGTGSLRYMAPEVASNQPYNEKADVYGFGVIFWEMVANDLPYKTLKTSNFYDEVVKKNTRPPIDPTWPPEVTKLCTDCWAKSPEDRPTFREIIQRLEYIRDCTNFCRRAPSTPPEEAPKPVSCCNCTIS